MCYIFIKQVVLFASSLLSSVIPKVKILYVVLDLNFKCIYVVEDQVRHGHFWFIELVCRAVNKCNTKIDNEIRK